MAGRCDLVVQVKSLRTRLSKKVIVILHPTVTRPEARGEFPLRNRLPLSPPENTKELADRRGHQRDDDLGKISATFIDRIEKNFMFEEGPECRTFKGLKR